MTPANVVVPSLQFPVDEDGSCGFSLENSSFPDHCHSLHRKVVFTFLPDHLESGRCPVHSCCNPAKWISSYPDGLTCHVEQLILHLLFAAGAPKSIPISRTLQLLLLAPEEGGTCGTSQGRMSPVSSTSPEAFQHPQETSAP